jgi:radical SAM protein with 4Fe4S-binding SPASM domain
MNFLHDFSFEFQRPTCVQLDITNRCNLNCFYCYNKDRELKNDIELTDNEILIVTSKICNELNPLILCYSGGEPLFRSDILFESIAYAKSKEIAVGLNTNAMQISEKMAHIIADLDVDRISVNIESSLPEIHDRIRGVKGAFADVTSSLLALKQIVGKDKISIAVVVNLKNIDGLLDLARFVSGHGFRELHLIDMVPHTEYSKKYFLASKDWRRFYGIYQEMLSMQIPIKPNHALLFMHGFGKNVVFPFCMAGRIAMVICANGAIVPCDHLKTEEFVCGNALKDDLLEVWQKSPRMMQFRYSLNGYEMCRECDLFKVCGGGCKALAKVFNGNAFSPDPYCTKLRLRDVQGK